MLIYLADALSSNPLPTSETSLNLRFTEVYIVMVDAYVDTNPDRDPKIGCFKDQIISLDRTSFIRIISRKVIAIFVLVLYPE